MTFSLMLLILAVLGFFGLLALGAIIFGQEGNSAREKPKYQYIARRFFLTRAENEFYNVLGQAVGHEYRIFAQVHLDSFLDEKVKGQDWRAAHAHINRKSVDFLLCDKEYLTPKLAIELDDKSHERADRKERDGEVERILKAAGIPLLRVQNHGGFTMEAVGVQVRESLHGSL